MSYDVILADPAWDFKTWSQKGAGRSPTLEGMMALAQEPTAADVRAALGGIMG